MGSNLTGWFPWKQSIIITGLYLILIAPNMGTESGNEDVCKGCCIQRKSLRTIHGKSSYKSGGDPLFPSCWKVSCMIETYEKIFFSNQLDRQKLILQVVCKNWEMYQNKHWLVVWNIFYFWIYWECHHPNWLSYFSDGLKPPTSIYIYIDVWL